MDEIIPPLAPVPAMWLEALTESRADLAAGLTVPGGEVMRALYHSIARLEALRPMDGQISRPETPQAVIV